MSSLRTVAVAGRTGRLGRHVVDSLLSPPFRKTFKGVILLTRAKTPRSENLEQEGATVRYYREDYKPTALKGVDVLVNTYVVRTPHPITYGHVYGW
jgi:nucleoside-diphosphate-sugar epimerase